MFLRPGRSDARLISYYVGRVLGFIGWIQLAPAAVALGMREWNALTAFLIGASLGVSIGQIAELRLRTREAPDWSHGLVVAALSWLLGSLLAAVPLYLSGHVGGYVDAFFEGMSGLTTSGLSVVQDLDHLAYSMNLWRLILQFAGGQGIIVAMLTLFAGAAGQAGTLYVGEAREERIMPNVVRTAQFIWRVALTFLLIGTAALWVAGLIAGLSAPRSLYHAVALFMAAFDTGGFTLYTASIGYYHSLSIESVTSVLMVAGALSFGVHYQLWRGNLREPLHNIETRSLAVTLTVLSTIALLGLARFGTYGETEALFRRGFYTMISAHTGTGFGVTPPSLFLTGWGLVAPAAVVGAMALGGMASSTAGGFKAIRVAITTKGLWKDIRQVMLPESALVVETYHSQRRRILRDSQIGPAVTILLLYLLTYIFGGFLGLFYGYDFTAAMFESTSATANVGLSVGMTGPALETPLKIVYTLQMWLGRLEFMAIFAMLATVLAAIRGRA